MNLTNIHRDAVKYLITKPNDIDFLYVITAGLRNFDEQLNKEVTEQNKDAVRARVWEYKRWLWSVLENIVPVYTKKLIVYSDQVTTDTDLSYFLKLLEGFGITILHKTRKSKNESCYESYVVSKNYDGWDQD